VHGPLRARAHARVHTHVKRVNARVDGGASWISYLTDARAHAPSSRRVAKREEDWCHARGVSFTARRRSLSDAGVSRDGMEIETWTGKYVRVFGIPSRNWRRNENSDDELFDRQRSRSLKLERTETDFDFSNLSNTDVGFW